MDQPGSATLSVLIRVFSLGSDPVSTRGSDLDMDLVSINPDLQLCYFAFCALQSVRIRFILEGGIWGMDSVNINPQL